MARPQDIVAPRIAVRHWRSADGRMRLLIEKGDDGYALSFPGQADFLIAPACDEIRYRCAPGLPASLFRHGLLDKVVPRALTQAGRLVLHASGVLTEVGALCFLGSSGQGKSTLAAAFGAWGAGVLADDALLVDAVGDDVYCAPAYPSVRLWPATAVRLGLAPAAQAGDAPEKLRCRPGREGGSALPIGPLPVRAILSLDRRPPAASGFAIELVPLPPAMAAVELLTHAFMLDITDSAHLARLMREAARVVAALPVYALRYPSDLDLLPQVCTEIVRSIDRG